MKDIKFIIGAVTFVLSIVFILSAVISEHFKLNQPNIFIKNKTEFMFVIIASCVVGIVLMLT